MLDKLSDLIGWIAGQIDLRNLVSPDTISFILKHASEFLLMALGFIGFLRYSNRNRTIDRLPAPPRKKYTILKKTLRIAGGAATVAGIVKAFVQWKSPGDDETEPLPGRQLGSMGFNASILGMGGGYTNRGTLAEGFGILKAAHALGVNYFDTASQYGDGESERRYGLLMEALEAEGSRGEVFLATKTLSRGYNQAVEEIEGSFARLRTEYIDLLQVHAVNDIDTWRQVTARDGSLKAIEQAKESGRVRHIGISGHQDPGMILEAIEEYPFDSVLIPLGITDRYHVPFVEEVLPACVAKGLSVVAMKVFAEGHLVEADVDLQKCFHYTLSLPVSTAIIGMKSLMEVIQNVVWTRSFLGMPEDEIDELESEVMELIDTDVLWWKK